MKDTFDVEFVKAKHVLSKNQQLFYLGRLKRLVSIEGIIGICLDYAGVFIEYRPGILNKDSLMGLLMDINFPMNKKLIKSPIIIK
jgi:hypothetical protein